jgi:hypothetical protein
MLVWVGKTSWPPPLRSTTTDVGKTRKAPGGEEMASDAAVLAVLISRINASAWRLLRMAPIALAPFL